MPGGGGAPGRGAHAIHPQVVAVASVKAGAANRGLARQGTPATSPPARPEGWAGERPFARTADFPAGALGATCAPCAFALLWRPISDRSWAIAQSGVAAHAQTDVSTRRAEAQPGPASRQSPQKGLHNADEAFYSDNSIAGGLMVRALADTIGGVLPTDPSPVAEFESVWGFSMDRNYLRSRIGRATTRRPPEPCAMLEPGHRREEPGRRATIQAIACRRSRR
jgi:hypothetical protein